MSEPVPFGAAGAGPGEFSNPTGVAVDEVAPGDIGDVYVVDQGNNRVQRFSASGAYLGEFDGSGTLSPEEAGKAASAGALSAPTWIAVDNSTSLTDPSAGDVYVVDSGHNTIDKFTAEGAYLGQVPGPPAIGIVEPGFGEGLLHGLAVDPTGGLWVYNGHTVDRYDNALANASLSPVAGWETTFGIGNPGFVVDSSEHVYLNRGFASIFQKYTGEGEKLESLSGECASECTSGAAIDQSTSSLFVARPVEGVGPELLLIDTSGGELQQPFGLGQLGSVGGLAVNDATHALYVADPSANVVKIFPRGVLAEFTPGSASAEQPTSAVVSATVNPDGLATTCQIEYGTDTTYGTSVPCSPENLGSATTPVPIAATLTGLTSGETYHYRIVTTNSTATTHGEDQTFRLTPPPLVDEQPGFATSVSQFTATLNGTINPYNIPTSYHFVYVAAADYRPGAGECPPGLACAYAMGVTTPVPSVYTTLNSNNEAVIPQTIGGLQPGTTYHFALVATAPGGTIVSPDETFTTPGIPLPEVATGGASAASERAVTLTGTVNPRGWETTYQFQYGTTTAYGAGWPSVGVQAGQFASAQGISVYLERLQPATTYHYRLLATNPAGTTYGADQTFTTTAYPVSAIQEPAGGPPKVVVKPAAPAKKALTNAQKLAAALKGCQEFGFERQKACEKRERKKYAHTKKPKKRKKKSTKGKRKSD